MEKIFSSFVSNLLPYNKKTTFNLSGLFFWKYVNINYIFHKSFYYKIFKSKI